MQTMLRRTCTADDNHRKSTDGQHQTISHMDATYLAFSFRQQDSKFDRLKNARDSDRLLLQDRKYWLEHLSFGALAKSITRVIVIQSTNVVASYLQDQLQADMEREEEIKEGQLTLKQADEEQEEWEEREWEKRIHLLPKKIIIGICKFQATTMIMRFLEFVAEKTVDEFTLDRLTIDSFAFAQRLARKTTDKTEIRQEMYQVCLYSSVISFLADYCVHQVILFYTYYRYYISRRNRRNRHETSESTEDPLPLIFSCLTKSTTLLLSRSCGLFAAAFGGGFGSMLYPGWGTTIGSQCCDGVVSSIFDELQSATSKDHAP